MDEIDDVFDWLTEAEATALEETVPRAALLTGDSAKRPVVVDTNMQARFRPLRELGRGGMCSVHDTEDLQLLRHTALKVMHPDVASEPSMHRQFIIEARITAQLDHPNIIPIHEFGQDSKGVPYINMRKVRGDTLGALIAEDPDERLSAERLKRIARIFARASEALAYAHSRGVIHRDIKPGNIMVGSFGEVYVMDWGVALSRPELATGIPVLTAAPGETFEHATPMAGSPSYVAPEQTQGRVEALGPWTDIFLLGGSLYHALTGNPPYGRKGNLIAVLKAAARGNYPSVRQRLPDRPLPGGLVRVVEKAMAIDPADRYQSMEEMRDALLDYLEGGGQYAVASHAPGSLIVREGDEGESAYIVIKGQCRVFCTIGGSEHEVGRLGPGDVFGEVAILTGGLRTSSVAALTHVELEVVTREALTGGLSDSATGKFVTALAQRFVDLERQVRGPAQVDG